MKSKLEMIWTKIRIKLEERCIVSYRSTGNGRFLGQSDNNSIIEMRL